MNKFARIALIVVAVPLALVAIAVIFSIVSDLMLAY